MGYFILPYFHGGSNGAGIWRLNADGPSATQFTNRERTSVRFGLRTGNGCITMTPVTDRIRQFPLRAASRRERPKNGLPSRCCCALGGLSPDGKQMPFSG